MRHRSGQSGFVLLMVLVLVLLAGVALAGLARRSLTGALASQGALEELQRRWAVRSCRDTLLGSVERLLDEAERGESEGGKPAKSYRNPPMAERRVTCRLAGIDYELVLTDEQAKVNLNRLLGSEDSEDAVPALGRLILEPAKAFDQPVAVKLRMLTAEAYASEQGGAFPMLGGYGQVFEGARPERLIGSGGAPALADEITCWGDGKVSVRRSSKRVMEVVCERTIGRRGVEALLAARERNPFRSVSALLDGVDRIDEKQRTKLKEDLTDRSTCHGLWVIARGSRRSWHTLAVGVARDDADEAANQRAGDQAISRRYEFEW